MSSASYELEQRVTQLANLPTLPGVIRQISALAENQDSGAAEVADIIAADQVLCAKVLRLVNSPVYGFPERISSIRHAVVLLGFNVVKGLVLGTAIFDSLGADGRGLWNHSLGTAIVARRIGKEIAAEDVEEIMMAGLLHDIGKVILIHLMPDVWAKASQKAVEKGIHISIAERSIFGADHCQVAEWVAREWRFPDRLSKPLRYHLKPQSAGKHYEITAIIHVADILARGMGYGSTGDEVLGRLDHDAYKHLGLSDHQIGVILADAEAEYNLGVDIFTAGG